MESDERFLLHFLTREERSAFGYWIGRVGDLLSDCDGMVDR